jgi:outer membrane protein
MRMPVSSRALLRSLITAAAITASVPLHATDLNDVLQDALTNDPKIGAARAGFLARNEIVAQGRSALLPQISVGGANQDQQRRTLASAFPGQDVETFFEQTQWQAEFRQPLLAAAQYFSFRAAQAQRDAARNDLNASEQELLLRVADAYFNVLRAQDQLDSATAEETAVKRQLEQVQQRFEVGLVAITDVLESQAVYDNAVVRRIQADGNHDIVFENLRTLTGKSYASLERLAQTLPVVYPEPRDEEAWVAQAMAGNFNIRSAQETLLAANRDVRARRSAHLPTIDAVATYSEFRTGTASSFGDSDTRSYALEARLPIFQGGAISSRVREGEYRAEQASQQLEDQRRTVARDTRNLFRQVITDVVRVRAGEKSIQSSKAALEATQTGYEVGTRNIVDVLQAQQRLYQAQFTYADSRYAYVTDLLRLKQAVGALLPKDIDELNAFLTDQEMVSQLPIGRLYQDEAPTTNPGMPSAVPGEMMGPGKPAADAPAPRQLQDVEIAPASDGDTAE